MSTKQIARRTGRGGGVPRHTKKMTERSDRGTGRGGGQPRQTKGKETLTFDSVRRLGLLLPDVEVGTSYKTAALKVRGKMFACQPTHRSAEPNSLVVRVPFEQRDAMIEDDPATYYVKEHYQNYPVVLVRLNRVHEDALRDLLQTAWRVVSESGRRRPARRPERS